MPAWRLVRFDEAAPPIPRRFDTPFVGRANELAQTRGVRSKFQVWPAEGIDDVAGVVTAVADTHKPSLIVVGCRGRGTVSGAVLGSVSRAILGTTDLPVVVVHARAD